MAQVIVNMGAPEYERTAEKPLRAIVACIHPFVAAMPASPEALDE
jgi:hypothetical protein